MVSEPQDNAKKSYAFCGSSLNSLLTEIVFHLHLVDWKKDHAGHHIGDFLPPEELEKFNAQTSGKQFASRKNKIASDNKGHQMLTKMGWSEGSRLGANNDGITGPVGTHQQQWQNQGVGAGQGGDVSEGDDAFEIYKKKMMLSYRFRPNPLVCAAFCDILLVSRVASFGRGRIFVQLKFSKGLLMHGRFFQDPRLRRMLQGFRWELKS